MIIFVINRCANEILFDIQDGTSFSGRKMLYILLSYNDIFNCHMSIIDVSIQIQKLVNFALEIYKASYIYERILHLKIRVRMEISI